MAAIKGYELAVTSSGAVDWKPSNNASRTTGRKGSKNYLLKIYIRYPDPKGFSPEAYEEAKRRCKQTYDKLDKLNKAIKRGDSGSGHLAYATEIIDNKTGADQGIIEVVPFVEGGIALDKYTGSRDGRIQLVESLAEAMSCLHSVGVRHADLKLENALCVMHGSVPHAVLIDFDHSCLGSEVPHPDFIGGTDGYLSPEVVEYFNIEDDEDEELMARLQSRITLKSDIFALGIMFYLILTGDKPAIVNSAFQVDPGHPLLGGGYLSQLIEAMVSEDPDDRPDADQVLQSLREKEFADDLPPFEDVWPEHEGYRYAEKSPGGRVVKRVRRHKQNGELSYSVTFEGYSARVYSFTMMRNAGLLIGERGPRRRVLPPDVVSAPSADDVTIPGYTVLCDGLSADDQKTCRIDTDRLRTSGYVRICCCREKGSGAQTYVLLKRDGAFYARSLKTLMLQKIVVPK